MGQGHTTFDVARSGAHADPLSNTLQKTRWGSGGLYFEVDHDDGDILLNAFHNTVSARDLLQAAAHMAVRMKDELWGYLGISVNAEIVSESSGGGGCSCGTRRTITACGHDAAAAWRSAVAAGEPTRVQLVKQEGGMAAARSAAMGRFTSAPSNRPGEAAFEAYLRDLWDPARDRMLQLLDDVTVGLAVWSRPNSVRVVSEQWLDEAVNVLHLGRTVPSTGYEIWMNPFTWFALDGGACRYNFQASSPRAAAACGPTMILLHESEHERGYITAAPPAGDPQQGEEQGPTIEIDRIMARHPDVAPRHRYTNYPRNPSTDDPHDFHATGHHEDGTDSSETLPGDVYVLHPTRDRAPGETTEALTARGREWVRWASRSQLLTGRP